MGHGRKSVEELRAIARSEITAGKHWRAKEILKSQMTRPYSPAIAEELGLVLLRMHDTLEAGKYLFLSGVRKPEYEDAIALWVSRAFKRGKLDALYDNFFRSAKLSRLADYPEPVQQDLIAMGATARRFGRRPPVEWNIGVVWKVAGVVLFLAALWCLLVGIITTAAEVRRYFS